jgi:hypothetical protein
MLELLFAGHRSVGLVGRASRAAGLAGILALAVPLAALASQANETISDSTAPSGSVTLSPGETSAVTLTIQVTGAQVGPATFTLNRDFTLAGGSFTGSNPQTFSVAPQGGGTTTTFTTTGTLTIAAGQAPGTFPLTAGVFAVTNPNTPGAKLSAGSAGTYAVTVQALPPVINDPPAVVPPSATPELDSFVLFGVGALGLAGLAWWRRKAPPV